MTPVFRREWNRMDLSREQRWQCENCLVVTAVAELLKARNPFRAEEEITGCPNCKSIGGFKLMCDEPNCPEICSCGWTSSTGYRNTCYGHMTEFPR